ALALLVGIVVGDGVAVLDRAHPRARAGREDHGFEQRRLPGSTVSDEQDVADVLRLVGLHGHPSGCGRASEEGILRVLGSRRLPMRTRRPDPPGTAPTRFILFGGAALAAGAAALVLAGRPRIAAIAAAPAAAALLVGGHRANHGAGGP